MDLSRQQMLFILSLAVVCFAMSYYFLSQELEDPFPMIKRQRSLRELRKKQPLSEAEADELNERYRWRQRGGISSIDEAGRQEQERNIYSQQRSKTVPSDPHGDRRAADRAKSNEARRKASEPFQVHPRPVTHEQRVDEARDLRQARQMASQRHASHAKSKGR